jgi:hypothetical protein
VDKLRGIIEEDASDETVMRAAAEQMKNIKPDDIDKMIKEMENMGPIQRQALKAMGMDPEAMKQTMKMMKDNPQMIESAQRLMSTMTPQQMLEQSRMAQERMKGMTPEQIAEASKAMSSIPKEQLDQAVQVLSNQPATGSNIFDAVIEDEEDNEPSVIATGPGTSSDSKVIDAMFAVAEFMSTDGDATGKGVTLSGFASLPVIHLLSGPNEQDLSPAELRECWASGSLGATKVDRNGFERVWKEVQDYFEDDIMGEARAEAKKQVSTKQSGPKHKRGGSTPKPTSPAATVGQQLNKEQLNVVNERVKNMNDQDVTQVLDAMEVMDPAQEARLKAMGIDPGMMRQTAKMLKSNPQMAKAAQEMMKKMSPEDMLKMSQQAQDELRKMTPEQAAQAMKEIQNTAL